MKCPTGSEVWAVEVCSGSDARLTGADRVTKIGGSVPMSRAYTKTTACTSAHSLGSLARSALAVALLGAVLLARPGIVSSATADETQYRIKAGDVLQVIIWNESDRPLEATVSTDGRVSLPGIGILTVANMTTEQLRAQITQKLKETMVNPRVSVYLRQLAPDPSNRVYVLGEVAKPGWYELQPGMRLLDVLWLAGGQTQAADLMQVKLFDPRGGSRVVDVQKIMDTGDMSLNIPLGPNTVLMVPESKNEVVVVGYVVKPGTYRFKKGDRLSDAIAAAGGPTQESDLKNATLTRRNGQTTPVNLEAILREGKLAGNVELEPGDVIHIPQLRNEVTLAGEFQRPGTYTFRPGQKILDAVSLGGGLTQMADPAQAYLLRGGKRVSANLEGVLKGEEMSGNILLQDGDVIIVPSGAKVMVFGEVQKPGVYTIKPGEQLLDVLQEAGGPTREANLSATGIIRLSEGKPTTIKADIAKLMSKGDMSQNIPVEKGDLIYVPRRGARVEFTTVLSTLATLRWFFW
ncbi:MAG: SLBB domain-containing protein [Armatimonadota bacterium]